VRRNVTLARAALVVFAVGLLAGFLLRRIGGGNQGHVASPPPPAGKVTV
jgi:hypothetical protein